MNGEYVKLLESQSKDQLKKAQEISKKITKFGIITGDIVKFKKGKGDEHRQGNLYVVIASDDSRKSFTLADVVGGGSWSWTDLRDIELVEKGPR
jgi:hypothetical protein